MHLHTQGRRLCLTKCNVDTSAFSPHPLRRATGQKEANREREGIVPGTIGHPGVESAVAQGGQKQVLQWSFGPWSMHRGQQVYFVLGMFVLFCLEFWVCFEFWVFDFGYVLNFGYALFCLVLNCAVV